MNSFINNLLSYFYFEGDILKSCLALFGFMFLFTLILEAVCILKQSVNSAK